MNLLFITFAPLSSNAGHLRHLKEELSELSELHNITIFCLSSKPDDISTKDLYSRVSFYNFEAKFNGWEVLNIEDIVQTVYNLNSKYNFDLVVLQMEVWDLMRELGRRLDKVIPIATVIHAMPFLSSPLDVSNNFEKDVIKYANSGISNYRKDYILNHYKEIEGVFKTIALIPSNPTVSFYFNNYFNNQKTFPFKSSTIPSRLKVKTVTENSEYDFVYMARMESGKGIEYLLEIFNNIIKILKRPIRVAIMGRADDSISKKALSDLFDESELNEYLSIDNFGWADENIKKDVLTKSGVFLYPSILDTFSIVLCEALEYGLPCVAWEVPFIKLNYDTKAVKQVRLLNIQEFAESTVYVLNNRLKLSREALNFVKGLNSPKEIASLDTQTFREIISYERN